MFYQNFRSPISFKKKSGVVTALLALCAVMYVIINISSSQQNRTVRISVSDNLDNEAEILKYRKQRNNISRQLNLMKRTHARLSCEYRKVMHAIGEKVNSEVSEYGGWCFKTSRSNSSAHVWDEGFSTALSKFLQGKTVASFGDGPGLYKKHLDTLGQVVSYDAFDGAPYSEDVSDGLVKFLDLTAPQYGLAAYDWVISVEVGEHIPAKFQNVYLDNLVRHAREGIILSWAIPGQEGLSHVNTKYLSEVVSQMRRRGFDIDKAAGKPLRRASSFSWLQANVHVYRRVFSDSFVPEDT